MATIYERPIEAHAISLCKNNIVLVAQRPHSDGHNVGELGRAMFDAALTACRRLVQHLPPRVRSALRVVWPERSCLPSTTGHSDPQRPGFNPYRLLWECQEEIAARLDTPAPCPHGYALRYRRQELGYWKRIPSWIYEDFRRRAAGGDALRCLDVGCAYGTLLLFATKLLGCEPYAVDIANLLHPALVSDYGIHYAANNIERDAFPWQTQFDLIVFTEVLEHLNFNALPTMEKLRRLLAPGGRLYLSTPDAARWGRQTKYYARYADLPMPCAGSQAAKISDHVWHFRAGELIQLAGTAGLRVTRCEYSPGSRKRHLNLTLTAS